MKGETAPVVSRGDGNGSCSQDSTPVKSPLYDAAATRRRAKGRKASAAASFVLDAAGMQELLDAAAARKETGLGAPPVAKRTAMGAVGKEAAAGTSPLRHPMEADCQGAGTAEGRQRTGKALGLKRKLAAMAPAPSVVASHVHDFTTFSGTGSSTNGSQGLSGIPMFTSGHATPPWMRSQASDPAAWDNNPHPPGGFVRLVGNLPQNLHFVGGTGCSSPPIVVSPTPHLNQDSIHLDSGNQVARTEKRILWTQEEDVRLMSAWLKNSTDSISGADRRNEQYWGDVVKTYNMTTPKHRTRNHKQAKDRWHKINRWVDLFHSAWLKARRIYTSGHSDQMWIDKAHKFYEEDNKSLNLGHFVLMDVWYAVRGEAKWMSYNSDLKKARQKKSEENPIEIEDENVHDLSRPMGQKKAKKMALDSKKEGKSRESAIDVEQLEKYSQVQSEVHANRLKVLEVQQKLSSEKLEASRLCHLAAVESKEAKMLEAYNSLLLKDTGGYSAEEKDEHLAALRCLRKRLFPED